MQRYYILLKATVLVGGRVGCRTGWMRTAPNRLLKKPKSRPRIITRSTKSLKFRLSKSKGEANEAGSDCKAH